MVFANGPGPHGQRRHRRLWVAVKARVARRAVAPRACAVAPKASVHRRAALQKYGGGFEAATAANRDVTIVILLLLVSS